MRWHDYSPRFQTPVLVSNWFSDGITEYSRGSLQPGKLLKHKSQIYEIN